MTRLAAMLALSMALSSCEKSHQENPEGMRARSQAVQAPASQALASPPRTASSTPPPPAVSVTARRPKLCEGQMDRAPRAFEVQGVSVTQAPGETPLSEKMPLRKGKWTWVNFWAAWCVPCIEEIPMLLDWEKRLGVSGHFQVIFVSLDDDERQLSKFLSDQPKAGIRRTYWLKEGEQRKQWLEKASLPADPQLPMHLLLDPKGNARCVVQGAVEPVDLTTLTSILAN